MNKLFILFLTLCVFMEVVMNAIIPTCESISLGRSKLSIQDIDRIANDAIQKFNVPGASISIVINDQIAFSRGYGFRDLDKKLPVTEHTLFPIGSCTKAFTALLLCQLVEEEKIKLDDPVQKYIPEFFLVDQDRTSRVTIRDLLAHRTGIARHDPIWLFSKISRSSVVDLLKSLEPASELRQEFQYNNFMYALAGIIIERLTEQTWEEAVSNRLLKPLQMKHSIPSLEELDGRLDFSLPYADINGTITKIPFRNLFSINPAGGIISNAIDMANWLKFQIGFAYDRIIQRQTLEDTHTIQMSFSSSPDENEKVYHLGYGLGWFIGKYRENDLMSHGGDIDGFSSEVTFLPEKQVGIVILTNSSTDGRYAIASIRNQIVDKILGEEDIDWVEKFQDIRTKANRAIDEALRSFNKNSQNLSTHPLENYVGYYVHPAYGKFEIKIENNTLFSIYGETKTPLYFKSEDTFASQSNELLVYGINPVIDLKFFKDSSGNFYKLEVPFEGFRAAKPITFMRELSQ